MSSTKLTSGKVTLNSSTATQIVAAQPGRKKVILDFGSGITFGDSSLTPLNGVSLNQGNSGNAELETQDAVFGIAVSGTPSVGFIELHD